MSENVFDKALISDEEWSRLQISRLNSRPNAKTAYGSGGYDANAMKAAFDAQGNMLKEHHNSLVDSLSEIGRAEAERQQAEDERKESYEKAESERNRLYGEAEAARNEEFAAKEAERAAKFDKFDLVQTPGNSTTTAMSQKAVTDYVPKVATRNLMTLTFANASIASGAYTANTSGLGSAATPDYLKLKDDRAYTFSWSSIMPEQTIYFNQYDKDKKFISRLDKVIWSSPAKNATVTFDDDCAYIRIHLHPFSISKPWENAVPIDFQMEVGSEATEYIPPFIISNSVIDVSEQVNNAIRESISSNIGDSETHAMSQKTATWIYQSLLFNNLIDPYDTDVKTGGYYQYDATNGYKWVEASQWNESGYIPVLPRERFVMGTTTEHCKNISFIFYDENKDFVYCSSLNSDENNVFTVPNLSNIRYIRVPFKPSYMLIKGEKLSNSFLYNYNALCRMLDNFSNNPSPSNGSHWNGKTWYAYGTSLTSEAQGKYVPYVAEFGGMNVVNKGIPGGALVANKNIYNALMSTTDGKVNADLITIEVGANDASAPLGEVTSMDTTTFCGALNTCLKNILMNCPKAQVVLMPSTRSRHPLTGGEPYPLDYQTAGGYTTLERDEAIRKVAEANGIYFIPFGSGLGLGLFRMQRTDKPYTVDNIHHTELGGYNLAQGVWSYLKNIPLWYNSIPTAD